MKPIAVQQVFFQGCSPRRKCLQGSRSSRVFPDLFAVRDEWSTAVWSGWNCFIIVVGASGVGSFALLGGILYAISDMIMLERW